MPSPLEDLVSLQELDTAIQRETAEIEAVPRLVEEADTRTLALEEMLRQERDQLEVAQKERRTLEGELDGSKEKLSKYQNQLMEVKSNEAYRAMLKEIDAVKADVAVHEEKILERMLLADDLEADVAAKEKEFEAARASIEVEKKELARRAVEAEKRRGELEGQRDAATSRLPADVLIGYDRVARMRAGLAVIEVRDELCLGCRVKVRPQVYQEIMVSQELRQCDSCGRFLYVRAESDSNPADPKAPQAPVPGGSPGEDTPRKDEPTA